MKAEHQVQKKTLLEYIERSQAIRKRKDGLMKAYYVASKNRLRKISRDDDEHFFTNLIKIPPLAGLRSQEEVCVELFR